MKRVWKKNQVVLTLLAVMIAVAGYLNYTADSQMEPVKEAVSDQGAMQGELLDISDEDILAENSALTSALQETLSGSDDSVDSGSDQVDPESEQNPDTDIPGTAVLTGTPAVLDYVAGVQLSREQTRARNKETLMNIINNTNVEEIQKQEAIDTMLQLTSFAEKETAAESLLSAKGFQNSIVYINEDSVDVVISLSSISDAQRAQIEDIVKRKAEVTADKIVITLLELEE